MTIDNHVHIGWFTDGYHTPRDVWNSAVAAGVDGMAVSSTSTCAEHYKVVIREMRELLRLAGDRIHPILWLTPEMMKCRYPLPLMLRSGIPWQGVKLHFEAHHEWAGNGKLVRRAMNVARKLGVPVLLHTGGYEVSHAARFAPILAENPDLTFILAHGRPVDEAITMLQRYSNALVDTAFMPQQNIAKLVQAGLAGRIIFGTDAPINLVYHPEVPTAQYIGTCIAQLRQAAGSHADSILSRCPYQAKV